MKYKSIYLVGLLFLISCHHAIKKNRITSYAKSNTEIHKPKLQKTPDTLAIPDDTVPRVIIPEGTIQVAQSKADTAGNVKILEETVYSEQDDIGPKEAKFNWKGIFHNKYNYYIKPTKISFTRAQSELDNDPDKPDQETGWQLKCLAKDSCAWVISGVGNLISGPVERVNLDKFMLYYAGQKKEFTYQGVKYTLYTTGTKRNGAIYNFKLFLLANVKGHYINQLIESLGNDVPLNGGSDDPDNIYISFVGDIDGDKIPDFIISVSGYAFGSNSLYLSGTAGNNAILQLSGYMASSD